jgi:hypothetical protein
MYSTRQFRFGRVEMSQDMTAGVTPTLTQTGAPRGSAGRLLLWSVNSVWTPNGFVVGAKRTHTKKPAQLREGLKPSMKNPRYRKFMDGPMQTTMQAIETALSHFPPATRRNRRWAGRRLSLESFPHIFVLRGNERHRTRVHVPPAWDEEHKRPNMLVAHRVADGQPASERSRRGSSPGRPPFPKAGRTRIAP